MEYVGQWCDFKYDGFGTASFADGAVYAGDWKKAADEMIDSAWYRQVPNRAGRLVTRMKALA